MSSEVKKLGAAAAAMGALAAIVLTTLAVIQGFKDSGKVDNTTAGYFSTGVTIFGSFAAVVVLAIIGKLIIKLFQD